MAREKRQNPFIGDFEIRFRNSRGRPTSYLSKAAFIYVRLPRGKKYYRFEIPKKLRTIKARTIFLGELVSEIRRKRELAARKRAKKKRKLAAEARNRKLAAEARKLAKRKARKPIKPAREPRAPKIKPSRIRREEEREEYLEEEVKESLGDVRFHKIRYGFKQVFSKVRNAILSLEFMHYDLQENLSVTPENVSLIEKFLREGIQEKWDELLKDRAELIEFPFMVVIEHEGMIKRFNKKTKAWEAQEQYGYSRKREELALPSQFQDFMEDYFKAGGTGARKGGWKECMNEYLKRQVSARYLVKGFFFEFLLAEDEVKA